MIEDDDKSPRSVFDDGRSYSPVRRKYKRSPSAKKDVPLADKPKKLPSCAACGGSHYTRSCSLGR